MLEWLQSLWKSGPSPSKTFVSFDERVVTHRRPDNAIEEIAWDDLAEVEIVTTDAGPIGCEVFFVLHGDRRGCSVALESDGSDELLRRLHNLPGFKHEVALDALCCTSNARFSVWKSASSTSEPTRPWRYRSTLEIDQSDSVIADTKKQRVTVTAEVVYHSMKLACDRCGEEFWFSANEQRVWYEEWGFWIDSVPKQCPPCRRLLREERGRA
jgi:hypothetical protein